ncbi:MAG: anti-anti-sigma factor [Sideroxydans sp.]|nr:anti-anti-sigma factor [Sideroxydans sp.]
MSSLINVTIAGGNATITLDGRFDFHTQREFRTAYTPVLENEAIKNISIDFSRVNYIDSSALGLLMLIRERAESCGKDVWLINPNETVRKIFKIANFDKLFKID